MYHRHCIYDASPFIITMKPASNSSYDEPTGLVQYFSDIAQDIADCFVQAYQYLPLSWYIMAIITVIPIFYHLPKQFMVWSMLVYCLSSGLVCILKRKTAQTIQTPLPPGRIEARSGYHFFSDLRIVLKP